jgi:hypothetical protein
MSDQPEMEQSSPLDALGILAKQHVELAPGIEHHELYTRGGLLSLLWYKAQTGNESAVVMGGGAMGGLLGGGGLYHDLGQTLAAIGIPAVSIAWRQPNNLDACTHDMLASMQLMAQTGPTRFVTIGHSFGGAIAIRAAVAVPSAMVPGVITLATQSAGCEPAAQLGGRKLLLFHGDSDSILPPMASEMVRMLAETGELVILPGADHLLANEGDQIIERLTSWIPEVLGS